MQYDDHASALLDLFESQGTRPFEKLGVLRSRRMLERSVSLQGERVEVARVEDVLAKYEGRRVPVRVYVPRLATEPDLLIVYLHGGGWVTGSVDAADLPCRALAQATGAVVASVEYRRAPETPFPGALEDAFAALQWLIASSARWGVEPDRVCVMGESAGANLAAGCTLLTRDLQSPPIYRQVLLYPPLLPPKQGSYGSYSEPRRPQGLSAASMTWFWEMYLQGGGTTSNPLAAPLLADDLSELPPAIVVTAEFDPLRDEGTDYAERLRSAGVPVKLWHFPGTIHGFYGMAGHLPQASEVTRRLAAEIQHWSNLQST